MSTTKTNKSYLKRIKVTKNGKMIARRPGQNHYNAKESSATGMSKRRSQVIKMDNKARSRFFATSN
jgi:ribosomal protein L35